jgi:hypothetical protein
MVKIHSLQLNYIAASWFIIVLSQHRLVLVVELHQHITSTRTGLQLYHDLNLHNTVFLLLILAVLSKHRLVLVVKLHKHITSTREGIAISDGIFLHET